MKTLCRQFLVQVCDFTHTLLLQMTHHHLYLYDTQGEKKQTFKHVYCSSWGDAESAIRTILLSSIAAKRTSLASKSFLEVP